MNQTIIKTKTDFEVLQENKEICISCGVVTEVNIDTDTTLRENYVDGCGQLCNKCFIRIYGS